MSAVHTVKIRNPDITINYFDSLDSAARHAVGDDGAIRPGCMIAMNAEKIIKLRKTPELFDDCQNVIYYPDGAAALFFVKHKYPRIPGVELWLKVLEHAQSIGAKICVFGASESVSEEAQAVLSRRFPNAKLTIRHGFCELAEYERIVSTQKPDIVFVAMGTPQQEKVIACLQDASPHALFLGIGGSLDILIGKKRRAPEFFLNNNIEFAYRLICEPRRIFRQRALIYFFLLYYSGRFKKG